MDGAGGGLELPWAPGGQTAASRGGDPFAEWRRLRANQGDRVSLIRLYAMVAEPRGLAAHELPLAERRALAERARDLVRRASPAPKHDRSISPDMARLAQLVRDGAFARLLRPRGAP